MNTKTLSALAVAAVVALGAAIWINSADAPVSEEAAKDKPLLPGFRDDLNQVDALAIGGAGGKPLVTLRRGGEAWQVAERANYPADVAKLREYLYKLADARVLDTKTANPKRYAELGVEDPVDPNAKSILVAPGGPKDAPKLIVGLFNGQGGGGTFVRREGEAQSLLASGNLLADKNPAAWISKDLFDIDAAKIKEVRLTGHDGKTLRVYKEQASDGNFKVADLPKGREPASEFVANGLAAGLSNLRADDVVAAKDAPTADKPDKARYLGFDGLVVEVTAWEFDGKPYVQFAASVDEAQRDADIAAAQARDKVAYDTAVAAAKRKVVEAKGDDAAIAKAEAGVPKPASLADPAKDRADRIAAANKVAEDLNKKLRGWTYIIPQYAFSNFHKNLDDLLKPLETKRAAGAKGGKPALPILPKPSSTSAIQG
ncbi:MAG: DUF4340 domain-containing protein [Rudaea sp.]|uniref:DUF4340 domain-containing protein n=1 Tax=Rudaea sp. TaxID=2136325 RepID=UPI0039E33A84